jgi:hypothetical protein
MSVISRLTWAISFCVRANARRIASRRSTRFCKTGFFMDASLPQSKWPKTSSLIGIIPLLPLPDDKLQALTPGTACDQPCQYSLTSGKSSAN